MAACILMFTAKPVSFPDDSSRVNYAISYLTGNAGHWIRPILLVSPPHPIRGNWELFVSELNTMFGDPFVAASAERTLKNLVMTDKQQISTYIVEFSRWAPYTGWGSIPLGTKFYDGLPHRIKQGFRYMERPRELIPLQKVASSLDQYHWEVEKDTSGSSRRNPENSGNLGNSGSHSATISTTSYVSKAAIPATPGKILEAKKATPGPTPEYVKKLNPSGHLTQADRELRISGGLCLYCGTKGHSVANCPSIPDNKRRNPTGTSGRTAITLPPASPPTPELTATISEVIPGKA